MPNEMPESGKIWVCEMCWQVFPDGAVDVHSYERDRNGDPIPCGPIAEYTRSDLAPKVTEDARRLAQWAIEVIKTLDDSNLAQPGDDEAMEIARRILNGGKEGA